MGVHAGQWFASDLGDKRLVRLLRLPGTGGAGELGEPKLLRYQVVVKTSDVKGAGTCSQAIDPWAAGMALVKPVVAMRVLPRWNETPTLQRRA